MECELNRKDIWFSAGKKSKQPVYGASILHQPLPWTPHISLFQRVLQPGGGGSPRGKHNYIWCDMCCNHCMCSLGKWEKRGFIFSSWGQRSLPKLVLQGERRGGAFQVTESACGRYRRCLGSGGGFGQEGLDHGWQPGSDQGSGPFFWDANALQLKTTTNRPVVEQVGFMSHCGEGEYIPYCILVKSCQKRL